MRTGQISQSGKPVGAATVAHALPDVGQALSFLGTNDPRLASPDHIDLHLSGLLKAYEYQDPPPQWVQPIPVAYLMHVMALAMASTSAQTQAAAQLICLAFYFLMQLGEYCH